MADHDHGYKLLFSNPEMVVDLLRGFVKEPWIGELDFDTLERVGTAHISDDLRERADDMIWRVRWRKRWLYVYLILEFQSDSPWHMAVRIMTYVGLLYQELIRDQVLGPEGKLPPVLPLVLYNGERRWTAAEDIADLIEQGPPELARYQPHLRYLLLDEGRFSDQELAGLRNLVAALIRLEHSQSPDDVRMVVENLIEWLQDPELPEVKRAFVEWLRKVLLPSRLPGVAIPEVEDLGEVRAMLAERVREWTRPWVEEGLKQGLQQGREEGREEGRQEGRQEGVREGEVGLLVRQLQLKFGEIPDSVRQRVSAATREQLLLWADRIITAETLAGVFETD